MKLEVEFENHNLEKTKFNWNLYNDRRYVKAFIEVTNKWLNSLPDNKPNYSEKWFISTTEEDFYKLLGTIRKHVETIDGLGAVKIGSSKIDKNITREELNRLHEEFHKYVEKEDINYDDSSEAETAALCHKLNDLVHLTEIAWMNKDGKGDSRLVATAQPHIHVPYEQEDYKYYVTTPIRGELYVGYATPGKNLYHCFCDDDIPVVEKKLVRQSQGISPELHLEISGETEINKLSEATILAGFYKWCEDLNTKELGYNYTDPVYRPGKLPLGSIVEPISDFIDFIDGKEAKIINLNFI